MASLFLDTNVVIELVKTGDDELTELLTPHRLLISPLTVHILCYVAKIRVPSKNLSLFISQFQIVDLNSSITKQSLTGPTSDLEDNIQLHTALVNRIPFFITFDKALIKRAHFQDLSIIEPAAIT